MSPTPHHLQPILALTLCDPMDPRALCVYGLYSATVQVIMCGPALPYQVLFLKAAMKFMATSRSAADHARLRDRLFSCRCNLVIPEIRQLHHSAPSAVTVGDIFQLTLFNLCKSLAIALEVFRRNVHDASKQWPVTLDDINPFGVPPQKLCEALLSWAADASSGYAVFTLIGAMGIFSPRFKLQVLIMPPVFQLATTHLEYALENIPTHDINDLWAARFSAPVFACAANLFHALARNNPGILIAYGIQTRMLAIARRMQPHLELNTPGDMRDSCEWFTAVCARAGEAFVPTGRPAGEVSNAERGYLPSAWGMMVTMRNTKCTRKGCSSNSARAPSTSAVCGKCGVARYCGVEVGALSIIISGF